MVFLLIKFDTAVKELLGALPTCKKFQLTIKEYFMIEMALSMPNGTAFCGRDQKLLVSKLVFHSSLILTNHYVLIVSTIFFGMYLALENPELRFLVVRCSSLRLRAVQVW